MRGGCPQACIVAHHHAAKRLKVSGIGVGDTKMAKLHLRLGPGKGCGAGKGRWITVPVNKVQQCLGRGGNHRPECHAGYTTRRDADAPTDGKDRVKDCPCCARQWCVRHRRLCNGLPTPDELCPVGFDLYRGCLLSLDHGDMGGPYFGIVGRAASAGGDDDAQFGQKISHHEHFGKRRMRQIRGRRGQHQFSIGCHVHFTRATATVGKGNAAGFGIVFG